MGNESGEDDDGIVTVTDPRDLYSWVFFTMGASASACFVKSDDPERDKRARWAALTLGELVPAISAALHVAMAHPEEFAQHMKEPIRLRRMPKDDQD